MDSCGNEEAFRKGSLFGFLSSIPLLTLTLGAAGAPVNGALGSEQSLWLILSRATEGVRVGTDLPLQYRQMTP